MYVKYVEFLTSFLKIKLHQIELVLWKIHWYFEETEIEGKIHCHFSLYR